MWCINFLRFNKENNIISQQSLMFINRLFLFLTIILFKPYCV